MEAKLWAQDWPITQDFGVNPTNYAQFGLAGHNGLDIGMPIGTPIFAPFECTVAEVASDPTGYGNYVKVTTAAGHDLLVAHLTDIDVRVGQVLQDGYQIGTSGSTGNSTGPHLHVGFRLLNASFYRGWPYNGYIDPRQVLDLITSERWPTFPPL